MSKVSVPRRHGDTIAITSGRPGVDGTKVYGVVKGWVEVAEADLAEFLAHVPGAKLADAKSDAPTTPSAATVSGAAVESPRSDTDNPPASSG